MGGWDFWQAADVVNQRLVSEEPFAGDSDSGKLSMQRALPVQVAAPHG